MNKNNSKKDSYSSFKIHPERDWLILLCGSFILLVIVAGVGYYFYQGVAQGTLFATPVAQTSPAPLIDSTELDALVASFNARATQFNSLQNDPQETQPFGTLPQVVDPSL